MLIMKMDAIELEGRTFVPVEELPTSEWPYLVNEEQQSTLTIKDNDLFLVTDTLGNIASSLSPRCAK